MAIPGVMGWATAAVAPAASGAAAAAPAGASTAVEGAPFGDLLQSAIGGVDQLQQQAAGAVTGMLGGNGVDIHDAMIATQKADMAFELALAVRNKAVAAYQQVMGMQF
jgi:flagellar hook-basal body complex protein FliE